MGQLQASNPTPQCPVCDGPCTHEFERSDMRIPDKLTPEPPKPPKPNPRGKRAIHGPEQDRMVRPSEDR